MRIKTFAATRDTQGNGMKKFIVRWAASHAEGPLARVATGLHNLK